MEKKSKLNIKVFKRLLSYWRSYKTLFSIAVICVLLLAFIGPVRPFAIGYMVDKYIIKSQDESMLLFWTLIIVSMLLLEGILSFLSNYFLPLGFF